MNTDADQINQPVLRFFEYTRPMRMNATLRPADGSLRALMEHLRACKRNGARVDEPWDLVLTHIDAMLAHMRSKSLLVADADRDVPLTQNDIDALAQATNPNGDAWVTFFDAARQLANNARAIGQSQGGARDLITG